MFNIWLDKNQDYQTQHAAVKRGRVPIYKGIRRSLIGTRIVVFGQAGEGIDTMAWPDVKLSEKKAKKLIDNADAIGAAYEGFRHTERYNGINLNLLERLTEDDKILARQALEKLAALKKSKGLQR